MFKEAFKYYKSKQPAPDLSHVLNFTETVNTAKVTKISGNYLPKRLDNFFGLKPIENWCIFQIKSKPGLIFIKNPFTALGQRYWIAKCLKDFSRKPNKLNIDAHNYLNKNENWWDVCTSDSTKSSLLSNKLRWATLGYHHNWDSKIYSESSKGVFPEDVAYLCKIIAHIVGFNNFEAQAAIVNYYFMNSTLSGHTDHSEKDLEAPLFSFSFGQSAIFLIGGLSEDDPALPIFIHSGDILVMSKESRLCYHAVPKILSTSNEPWNQCSKENCEQKNELFTQCENDNYWQPFNNFIKTCRLNINVRQVLKTGQISLDE